MIDGLKNQVATFYVITQGPNKSFHINLFLESLEMMDGLTYMKI